MKADGPPRMVGWITWSGRERSSQTQFLPVPGVRLIHLPPCSNQRFDRSFGHQKYPNLQNTWL